MNITIIQPDDRQAQREFLTLPFRLYRNSPFWVPPLAQDAARIFDRKRNPFYRHSEAAFILAKDAQGAVIGRLAVLNNRVYNTYNSSHTAFFCCFECVDSLDVARELLAAGEHWAIERGLDTLLGPKGFSLLDGMGLLVEGFDLPPAFGMAYNPEYYPRLLEACGYTREEDILSGNLPSDLELPAKVFEVARRVEERRGLSVRAFRSRRDLWNLVPALKSMYNQAIQGTSGNMPLNDEEINLLARQMMLFADPRLIKIIFKEDRPVGFLFAYPNINAALRRCRGRLFPLGWLDIVRELRAGKTIDINGAGIIDEYRGMGATAILFREMYLSAQLRRPERVEVVQIGAGNERMLNELRGIGVNFNKRHANYRKDLSA